MNTTAAQVDVDWKPSIDAYLVVLPVQMFVSFIGWSSSMLALNRIQLCKRLSNAERVGALLYFAAAFIRTATALATKSGVEWVQASTALIGSTISWAAFIVIFNDRVMLPTRQQFYAIVLSATATAAWELQNYIVVHQL